MTDREQSTERVEAHNISMYPADWNDVYRVGRESNIKSLSGALRIIMQEWRELKQLGLLTKGAQS